MKMRLMIILALVTVFATLTSAQDTLRSTTNPTVNQKIHTQNNVTNATIVADMDDDDDIRDNFHIGLKAGVNFSNVYDRQGNDFESDGRLGLVAGAFFSIPFGTYVGLQPEILYSEKGYTGTGTFLGLNYNYTRSTSYIDVPVFLQIKPSPIVTLVVGPQFSFLINHTDDFDNNDELDEIIEEFDNVSLRNTSIGIGGGLDLNFYPIVISGRVGFDLQNVHDEDIDDVPRYSNVWFQLTGGIMF